MSLFRLSAYALRSKINSLIKIRAAFPPSSSSVILFFSLPEGLTDQTFPLIGVPFEYQIYNFDARDVICISGGYALFCQLLYVFLPTFFPENNGNKNFLPAVDKTFQSSEHLCLHVPS